MLRSRSTLLSIALAVTCAPPARAQSPAAAVPVARETPASTPESALPPPARAMSLADAIAFARAHQPAVLLGLARIAAQKEAAKVPRAQWYPHLGITAQIFGATANNTTASYLTESDVDIPRIGGTTVVSGGTWQPYASTFVAAGAKQEAFDFGRIAAQAAAADAAVEVQKQSSAAALLDVTYAVVEAYFAVNAAKSVRRAAADAYVRARAHRDLAKSGVDSGMRPPIDLTRAEADLARFDAGRIEAQGGLDSAEAFYAIAVGVPDAALEAADVPATPPDLPTLNDAIQLASARDPRILAAIAELRAQEATTRAIGAETRPDLTLTGLISGRAGGAPPSGTGDPANQDGWLPNVPNWDVGAVFSWPLFDAVVRARADASHAAEEARREELNRTRFQEVGAIRAAYITAAIARKRVPALQQALDAARANWAQADARFRAGLGTAVELADAEALLAAAEINLALGVFDIARTRAAFGRAIAETL